MSETPENRLRRLRMRSWRRGIKEMDLILGSFADRQLADLSDTEIILYDALLSENDQELYAWVTGQETPPDRFAHMVSLIAHHANAL
ncbi:succinate dehydrogenase assembly factor 2 [Actibacterium sp. 188UL27-1]|uniref:FAD assembly factor SdhE n=1 Tax=Actibacterium sp. 188UL27-1 TaxID=2786961 RepID=UPI00195C2689|nr:succinate dehydrogenase assembly factor 2 [Actibacterium sp. 188UL27-1]MBM7066874.1 succinate dehydrogenase assembly factor 2 [Actibacterium sp. 188UL27-1]